jgi:hypothetical protein
VFKAMVMVVVAVVISMHNCLSPTADGTALTFSSITRRQVVLFSSMSFSDAGGSDCEGDDNAAAAAASSAASPPAPCCMPPCSPSSEPAPPTAPRFFVSFLRGKVSCRSHDIGRDPPQKPASPPFTPPPTPFTPPPTPFTPPPTPFTPPPTPFTPLPTPSEPRTHRPHLTSSQRAGEQGRRSGGP